MNTHLYNTDYNVHTYGVESKDISKKYNSNLNSLTKYNTHNEVKISNFDELENLLRKHYDNVFNSFEIEELKLKKYNYLNVKDTIDNILRFYAKMNLRNENKFVVIENFDYLLVNEVCTRFKIPMDFYLRHLTLIMKCFKESIKLYSLNDDWGCYSYDHIEDKIIIYYDENYKEEYINNKKEYQNRVKHHIKGKLDL